MQLKDRVWVMKCFFKYSSVMKDLLHFDAPKDFSSVLWIFSCLLKLFNLGNFLSHFVQLWRILWELIFWPEFLHNFFLCFVCHVKTTTDLQNIFLHKVFPTKLRVYNFADIFFHVVFNNSTEWLTPTGISDLEP